MDQRIDLSIVQAVATHFISRADVQQQIGGLKTYATTTLPYNMDGLVLSIVSLFAAENIENVEIKYPVNWWEAFKEETAPQMIKDRWPVKYARHVVDIKAVWKGYQYPPGADKYGPFLPYVLHTELMDGGDE